MVSSIYHCDGYRDLGSTAHSFSLGLLVMGTSPYPGTVEARHHLTGALLGNCQLEGLAG